MKSRIFVGLVAAALIFFAAGLVRAQAAAAKTAEERIKALEEKVVDLESRMASKQDLGTIQNLITEFADEVALLGVKVTVIEDTLQNSPAKSQ